MNRKNGNSVASCSRSINAAIEEITSVDEVTKITMMAVAMIDRKNFEDECALLLLKFGQNMSLGSGAILAIILKVEVCTTHCDSKVADIGE